jgi:hypothetical protein
MDEKSNMLQFLKPYSTKDKLHLTVGVCLMLLGLFSIVPDAVAHAVTAGDKGYIQETTGINAIPFMYLGAKHMMTGYDHLLFLLGVIFFLYRLRHIFVYVSLFAIGHVLTLLSGVLMEVSINAYIIDAIIGFSIVYKALDNMGAYQRWFGVQPNTKIATFLFGLLHGFGLAAKILEYELSTDGLVLNLIFFNIGVEIGQILALAAILIAITFWRKSGNFMQHAYKANAFIMMLGFLLMGFHITGYFIM